MLNQQKRHLLHDLPRVYFSITIYGALKQMHSKGCTVINVASNCQLLENRKALWIAPTSGGIMASDGTQGYRGWTGLVLTEKQVRMQLLLLEESRNQNSWDRKGWGKRCMAEEGLGETSSYVRGMPISSDRKESACNAGDPGSVSGSVRFPGGGHGKPLQDSCWRIPRTEEPGSLPYVGSQTDRTCD